MPVSKARWVNVCCSNVLLAINKVDETVNRKRFFHCACMRYNLSHTIQYDNAELRG